MGYDLLLYVGQSTPLGRVIQRYWRHDVTRLYVLTSWLMRGFTLNSEGLGIKMPDSVAHRLNSPKMTAGDLRDLVMHRYAQYCTLQRTPLGDYQLKQLLTTERLLS